MKLSITPISSFKQAAVFCIPPMDLLSAFLPTQVLSLLYGARLAINLRGGGYGGDGVDSAEQVL